MVLGSQNAQVNLADAAAFGAAGTYTPRVQATYTPDKAADAHAHLQGGHAEGKVVLTL